MLLSIATLLLQLLIKKIHFRNSFAYFNVMKTVPDLLSTAIELQNENATQ